MQHTEEQPTKARKQRKWRYAVYNGHLSDAQSRACQGKYEEFRDRHWTRWILTDSQTIALLAMRGGYVPSDEFWAEAEAGKAAQACHGKGRRVKRGKCRKMPEGVDKRRGHGVG
jgi:hypothetical protein